MKNTWLIVFILGIIAALAAGMTGGFILASRYWSSATPLHLNLANCRSLKSAYVVAKSESAPATLSYLDTQLGSCVVSLEHFKGHISAADDKMLDRTISDIKRTL